MFMKSNLNFLALFTLLITSEQALGRERWLERDGQLVYLYPRRFGQEQPAVLQKIRDACESSVCGTLAGQAVTPLLAAQPECSQQDMADAIIDASKQFDAATATAMVAAAVEYRQVEKNTPPDFTSNPPKNRNSVFCQKAPKNKELNGLVQAQDPANDPNLFFDPAKGATVLKGSQADTFPFNSGDAVSQPPTATATEDPVLIETGTPDNTDTACPTAVTVTVTNTLTSTPTDAVTVTVGDATTTAPTATAAPPAASNAVGNADFGSCTVPEIEFGVGFDNRTETSFQPTDKQSFNHGSAQNIAIITQFICDQLTNSCNANQDAKNLCQTAQAAAIAATPAQTGVQADTFNAAFGITTDFAAVPPVDDQGRTSAPPVPAATAPATPATSSTAASSTPIAPQDDPAAPAVTSASTSSGNSSIGNFGKCTVPQIKFGTGFDNRKETSFEPVDLQSYNHGSAQNINIITQFICDTLTNTCGADQTAKNTCATATSAASAQPQGSGAQADAFNKVFGIVTDFAAVPEVDNQGNVISTSASATPATTTTASPSSSTGNTAVVVSTGGNLQTFSEALGGVVAPTVTSLGNGQFQVEGNSVFNDQKSAIDRSCDVQNNNCANAANASGNKNGFTVAACNAQQTKCLANA